MNIHKKINEIIEPGFSESFFSRLYDWCMLIAIAISIIPLMFRENHHFFGYFEVISCSCFVLDYILRWVTADLRSTKNRIVAFIVYPFTPMAIIDLLSILPISPSSRLLTMVLALFLDFLLVDLIEVVQQVCHILPC